MNTHWRVPDRSRGVPEGGTNFPGFSWNSHEPAKLDVNAGVISSALGVRVVAENSGYTDA